MLFLFKIRWSCSAAVWWQEQRVKTGVGRGLWWRGWSIRFHDCRWRKICGWPTFLLFFNYIKLINTRLLGKLFSKSGIYTTCWLFWLGRGVNLDKHFTQEMNYPPMCKKFLFLSINIRRSNFNCTSSWGWESISFQNFIRGLLKVRRARGRALSSGHWGGNAPSHAAFPK